MAIRPREFLNQHTQLYNFLIAEKLMTDLWREIQVHVCPHIACRAPIKDVYYTNASEHILFNTLYMFNTSLTHDDVIKWKKIPRYWPFVWGIHRSPVNSPQKGQWREALMFSLICTRINGWVNNGEDGDLRRHRAHYDVTVMSFNVMCCPQKCKKALFRQSFLSVTENMLSKYEPPNCFMKYQMLINIIKILEEITKCTYTRPQKHQIAKWTWKLWYTRVCVCMCVYAIILGSIHDDVIK